MNISLIYFYNLSFCQSDFFCICSLIQWIACHIQTPGFDASSMKRKRNKNTMGLQLTINFTSVVNTSIQFNDLVDVNNTVVVSLRSCSILPLFNEKRYEVSGSPFGSLGPNVFPVWSAKGCHVEIGIGYPSFLGATGSSLSLDTWSPALRAYGCWTDAEF